MRHLLPVALSLVLPALSLTAQTYQGEGPGRMAPPRTNPRLGATALGVAQVAQLLLTPVAGSRHYLTATVKRVGGTSYDLLAGEFDEATETFVANSDVVHFNGAGDEFALSVSHDRLTAVYDSPQGVMWAARQIATQPFGAPARVKNLHAGYLDPQLCTVEGEQHLMFLWGSDLWIGRFESGVVFDSWLLVARPPTTTALHSPSPITTADGEMKALVFSGNVPGRNANAFFQSSLDATDAPPSHQILDTPTWLANPDANGGRVRYAEATSTYTDPIEVELVAVASAEAPASGGTNALDLVMFGPTRNGSAPTMLGTIALGVLGTGPLPLPFLGGSALSLDPSSLVMLPPAPIDRATGTLRYRISLPSMQEVTMHAVPLVFDGGARGFLGNAGKVKVKAKEATCAKAKKKDVDASGNCPAGYVKLTLLAVGAGVKAVTACFKCEGVCGAGKTCTPVVVTIVFPNGSSADLVKCYCR